MANIGGMLVSVVVGVIVGVLALVVLLFCGTFSVSLFLGGTDIGSGLILLVQIAMVIVGASIGAVVGWWFYERFGRIEKEG